MPRSAHRELHAPRRRDFRLGETTQCRSLAYQLDVHDRKGPSQNGAHLSEAGSQIRPTAKSQNLCAEVLAPIKYSVSEVSGRSFEFHRRARLVVPWLRNARLFSSPSTAECSYRSFLQLSAAARLFPSERQRSRWGP